jgi:uncharacterized protein
MLIEFTVGNFLSIKDEVTLSMVASNPVKELEDLEEGQCNVFFDAVGKNKYLKSAVIYGANGSGKSNLLAAMQFFKRFILTSSNDSQAEDEIHVMPFLLSSETSNNASSFEMVFVIDSIRYRYGFEANKDSVSSEWLFAFDLLNSQKESYYFTREKQSIKVNSKLFKEGKGLENKTRANSLFLSTVAQLNGQIAIKIQNWFKIKLNIISGLEDTTTGFTIQKFQEDEVFRSKVLDFFKLINLGIEDIKIEETALENLARIIPTDKKSKKITSLLDELQRELNTRKKKDLSATEISINLFHKKFDEANHLIENIALDFGLESKGTQKLFGLLGPWFDILEKGEILIVDELDSRLHTKLTSELLRIFQSKINSRNAQLVFASHDTNLLRGDLFRRDQIWFTEKNQIGATDLYSLDEYKINQATSVRNDASFEKDYLSGKYGAIPYFGDIQKFITEFAHG